MKQALRPERCSALSSNVKRTLGTGIWGLGPTFDLGELGPPAIGARSHQPFFWGGFPVSKIGYRKRIGYQLILTSLLEDLENVGLVSRWLLK